ncbi:MAG: hypothetical protein V4544_03765 [Pseudomonadota bacterium]
MVIKFIILFVAAFSICNTGWCVTSGSPFSSNRLQFHASNSESQLDKDRIIPPQEKPIESKKKQGSFATRLKSLIQKESNTAPENNLRSPQTTETQDTVRSAQTTETQDTVRSTQTTDTIDTANETDDESSEYSASNKNEFIKTPKDIEEEVLIIEKEIVMLKAQARKTRSKYHQKVYDLDNKRDEDELEFIEKQIEINTKAKEQKLLELKNTKNQIDAIFGKINAEKCFKYQKNECNQKRGCKWQRFIESCEVDCDSIVDQRKCNTTLGIRFNDNGSSHFVKTCSFNKSCLWKNDYNKTEYDFYENKVKNGY